MPASYAGYPLVGNDSEFTRAMLSRAPVRRLHARPSMFWNLSESEFAAALTERRLAARGYKRFGSCCSLCEGLGSSWGLG
jgi:hypothetical protein